MNAEWMMIISPATWDSAGISTEHRIIPGIIKQTNWKNEDALEGLTTMVDFQRSFKFREANPIKTK